MKDKKQNSSDLPEPIDIKMDLPPEIEKKNKKTNGKKVKTDKIVKSNDSIQSLMEKNLQWSKAIYMQNKKIRRRLSLMLFMSYLKLFLIVAPIVVAIVYLPPLIDQYMSQVGNIFSMTGGAPNQNLGNILLEGFGLDNIVSGLSQDQLQQIQEIINK